LLEILVAHIEVPDKCPPTGNDSQASYNDKQMKYADIDQLSYFLGYATSGQISILSSFIRNEEQLIHGVYYGGYQHHLPAQFLWHDQTDGNSQKKTGILY
jgi:hypothetical protein